MYAIYNWVLGPSKSIQLFNLWLLILSHLWGFLFFSLLCILIKSRASTQSSLYLQGRDPLPRLSTNQKHLGVTCILSHCSLVCQLHFLNTRIYSCMFCFLFWDRDWCVTQLVLIPRLRISFSLGLLSSLHYTYTSHHSKPHYFMLYCCDHDSS